MSRLINSDVLVYSTGNSLASIMSVSSEFPTPNSYCSSEAAKDKGFTYANDIHDQHVFNATSSNFPLDVDESSIISLFDTEPDQMLGSELVQGLRNLPAGIVTARQDAINWMFKVHVYYKFRPETAYLSVIYMDRFLASHTLPRGKGWPLQLLSVACLALAAKMEETCVPLLLDLQIIEPKFLFKPRTVQRMELLVMSSLKWQLRAITPFDFVHFFITKLPCLGPQLENDHDHHNHIVLLRTASDAVVSSSRVIDFLEFPPSTIAAAAVIWVTGQNVDDEMLGWFQKRVSKVSPLYLFQMLGVELRTHLQACYFMSHI